MTQILILVQEGWSRAVKKTLERYSVSMSVCVCVRMYVCVYVLGGGFVNCLPTLQGVVLPLQASEITNRPRYCSANPA